MKESDARRLLAGFLADAVPGEQASVQSQGQADHPHGPDDHIDGWTGTEQSDGAVTVEKLHAR